MTTASNAIRNVMADAAADFYDLGSGTAVKRFFEGTPEAGTLLCSFDLQNPAFSAAGATDVGTVDLLGVTIQVFAVAEGDVDQFIDLNRNGDECCRGSVGVATGVPATEPDITIDNPNVKAGQAVFLDDFQLIVPAESSP
jgi:hypothetical protein